jgi:hypothetical protein
MSVAYSRGQQLGRQDLNIFLNNSSGHPVNASEIYFELYDFTTGQEVLVGQPRRQPTNASIGEYYASVLIPLDARIGPYRARWFFREVVGGALQTVVQEFEVVDRGLHHDNYNEVQADLVRRSRILLRDNCFAGEELVEVDADGERLVVSLEDLWGALQ